MEWNNCRRAIENGLELPDDVLESLGRNGLRVRSTTLALTRDTGAMASAATVDVDKQLWLEMYRRMLLGAECELQLAKSHQRGLVHGACHTYVGQEAVAVGSALISATGDAVFSTHRGHGHALAKGVPPRAADRRAYGRATGCSRGRGGSMHLFSPEIGMMGTSGIVGPCILQAAGAGYSFKLLKTDVWPWRSSAMAP